MLKINIADTSNPAQRVPNGDYSQDRIIEKLQEYINCKKSKISKRKKQAIKNCKLPFTLELGICSGLTAYWLYHKRCGIEYIFINQIEKLLNWDCLAFKNNWMQKEVIFIEELLNNLALLHGISEVIDGTAYFDMHSAYTVLLPDEHPQVAPPEFSLVSVFTVHSLAEFIAKTIAQNKMVRIGNGFHAIGMMRNGNNYSLYHADHHDGPQTYHNQLELAIDIFAAFKPYILDETHLSLNFMLFDLSGQAPAKYYDKRKYYTQLLADDDFRNVVFNEYNVCHLAVIFQDQDLLDILFANGYVYNPWLHSKHSELDKTICYQDEHMLKFLLNHGIDADYTAPDGKTPLGRAIEACTPNLVHVLLAAGADPNLSINFARMTADDKAISPLTAALECHHAAAIILLIAYGADIADEDVNLLYTEFTANEADEIINKGLRLDKLLFKQKGILDTSPVLRFSTTQKKTFGEQVDYEVIAPLLTMKI